MIEFIRKLFAKKCLDIIREPNDNFSDGFHVLRKSNDGNDSVDLKIICEKCFQ